MTSNLYFRVDPRLVHATTMSSWVPELGAQIILIVDSELAEDSRRRTICELSAMGQLEVLFSAEERAHGAVSSLRSNNVLVLFSSLGSVERAMQQGLHIPRLNVGHLPSGPGKRELHPAVHVSEEDLETITRIESLGAEVFVQPLPRDGAIAIDTGPRILPSTKPIPRGPSDRSAFARLRVRNERGLHLRAAQTLAELAGTLSADVKVGNGREFVNAKSLLGLTTLAAGPGSWLEIQVDGPDARKGLAAISRLFETGFGEGVVVDESGDFRP
ncbi:MAG: HPr family phosphocarrier protein [Deltaproteobacteria bacterium]|nr:HPr family phosphocarrier protein [Deltaproteobacteria bacterium]